MPGGRRRAAPSHAASTSSAQAGGSTGAGYSVANGGPPQLIPPKPGLRAAGVSINRAGTLALVGNRAEGTVSVFTISGKTVTLVGLNYKEVRGDGALDADKIAPDTEKQMAIQRANAWLSKHGDPYALSVLDLDGRVGIDYGVYGVPETYIIDKSGLIRMKHTGPISPDDFSGKILPLVAELNK